VSSVTFHLATIKSRLSGLIKVVDSLLNQDIRTYEVSVEVYPNFPDFDSYGFNDPRIKILPFKGDLGDTGKFANVSNDWNLFVDDDIIYPEDYARTLIRNSVVYECPVGVHGGVIKPKPNNYFNDRRVVHFEEKHDGSFVNFLGTGTLCFFGKLVDKSLFEKPNMSDCYFATHCQQNRIPLYCVPRRAGWLKDLKYLESLWKSRGNGSEQTKIIQKVKTWSIMKK
jgi:hypothetical protein